jgi:hypothetical protein
MFSVDIIPSIYSTVDVGGGDYNQKSAVGSDFYLHSGTVAKIHYPEDTGLDHITYDVDANVFDGGMLQPRRYPGCQLINALGGLADKTFATLRPETNPDNKDGRSIQYGSRVLLLCQNGSMASPVIIGGLDNRQDSDLGEKALGHHSYFVFNGVKFSINDDGSWQLEQQGPTDIKGEPDFSNAKVHPDGTKSAVKQADVGTVVKVESNGNLSISTNGGKEQVLVNHQDGSITLQSSKIKLGSPSASEQLVLGNKWLSLMENIIDAITTITVPTPSGPSGTPINTPQFKALKKKLSQVLSNFVYTQENP